MEARRVFAIWSNALFFDSLRLLLDRPGIELVGAASDYVVARENILGLQADTVLVEENGAGDIPEGTLGLLEASPACVRIIRLSLDDNELIVYHREKRLVGNTSDLLQLIIEE
nr:hypothetical protein [Chloroflexota bacterium]